MLFSNALALGVVQAVNYLFPLITVPYLVHTLGVESFGLLGFATAIVTYFSLVSDYGFNISATRRVAKHRGDRFAVSHIFSTVMSIKTILLCLSFCVLFGATFFFDKLAEHQALYLLTFGVVAGQVLFPLWLFLGMEEMRYIPMINAASKTLFTASIFLLVSDEQDILWVPLLASVEAILAGSFALYFAMGKFNFSFVMPCIADIRAYLHDGWHVFISSLGINAYKTNAVLLLGVFSSNLVVGYFVIAKKLYDALGGVNSIIHQVFLPYISRVQGGSTAITPEIRKLFKICLLSSSLLLVFTIIFADEAVKFVAGEYIVESIYALYFFAFALFAVGINIPAAIYLLQSHHDKVYSKAILWGALLDVTLLLLLIPWYGIYGALVTVVCTEVCITVLLYVHAYGVYRHEKIS